jgi:hypothetical protein
MLAYRVTGPDESGMYWLAYPTPGAEHVLTLAGCSPSKALADEECARLNELQIVDRRAAIRDRADRIVDDLTPGERSGK